MTPKERRRTLTVTILSLSLLTVMAGAAVAPALDVIRQYFSGASSLAIQLIISMPAIFIALTSFIFPKLASRVRAKTLLLVALALYVLGGCAAGLANSIGLVLLLRALVGVAVGVIMPMSTGLLSFYYTRDKQDRLMGYSSALNQLGGVLATLASGLLATLSWRASFLVYAMGLICVVLVIPFLPNEYIGHRAAKPQKAQRAGGQFADTLKTYAWLILAMFLLMMTFFIYPSSFAMEAAKAGLSTGTITLIMTGTDIVGFASGLAFAHIRKSLGHNARFVAPVCFLAGFAILAAGQGLVTAIVGSAFIGFANGAGVPYIMSTATKRAGREAATTVMPLISAAMYLAQFVTPFVLSGVESVAGSAAGVPFVVACVTAVLLFVASAFIREEDVVPVHQVIQEVRRP